MSASEWLFHFEPPYFVVVFNQTMEYEREFPGTGFEWLGFSSELWINFQMSASLTHYSEIDDDDVVVLTPAPSKIESTKIWMGVCAT